MPHLSTQHICIRCKNIRIMEFNGLFQVYIEQYFLLIGEFKIFLDSGAVEALKN